MNFSNILNYFFSSLMSQNIKKKAGFKKIIKTQKIDFYEIKIF